MKLLDAQKIETEKIKTEKELKERIRKLNAEESASVKRLNELRTVESAEKKRIAEDLTLAKHKNEVAVKKSILLQEIKILESQKREALKPINEKKREAECLLEYAQKISVDAEKSRASIELSQKHITERINILFEREKSVDVRHLELDKREEKIKSGESEISQSIKEIGNK